MCISLRPHAKEGYFKIKKCVYGCVFMARKVALKLLICLSLLLIPMNVVLKVRNVYIAAYSCEGKLF